MGEIVIQKYYQQILDLYPSWRKLRCSDKPILTQTGIYIAPTWDDGYRIKFENHRTTHRQHTRRQLSGKDEAHHQGSRRNFLRCRRRKPWTVWRVP